MPVRDMNPHSQQASGRKPRLRPLDHNYVHIVLKVKVRASGLMLNSFCTYIFVAGIMEHFVGKTKESTIITGQNGGETHGS